MKNLQLGRAHLKEANKLFKNNSRTLDSVKDSILSTLGLASIFCKDSDSDLKEIIKLYERLNHSVKLHEIYLILNTRNPNDIKTLCKLGEDCVTLKKYQDALNYLGQALALQKDHSPNSAAILYNLGIASIETKDLPKAIEYLDKANKIRPNNYEILCDLGSAYFSSKLESQAEECWNDAFDCALTENDPAALINLGKIYNKVSQHQNAIKCYHLAYFRTPEDVSILGILSEIYCQLSDFVSVKTTISKYIEIIASKLQNATSNEQHKIKISIQNSLLSICDILLKKEELAEIIPFSNLLILLFPNDKSSYEHAMKALFQLGRLDEALEKADILLQIDSNDPKIHLLKGHCLMRNNNHSEAKIFYAKALQLAKDDETHDNDDVFSEVGKYYLAFGFGIESLPLLEEAAAIGVDDDKLFSILAKIYISRGDKDDKKKAKACLKEAIKTNNENNTEDYISHYELGSFLIKSTSTKAVQEGLEALQKAIEINPNHAFSHYKLAITYSKLANLAEATNHLTIARELDHTLNDFNNIVYADPTYLDVINANQDLVLAQQAVKQNHIDYALKLCKNTIKTLSIDPKLLTIMGIAYLLKGEFGNAKPLLEKALILDTKSPKLYNALGDLHFNLKNYSKAEDFYKKSIEFDRYEAKTHENLAKIYMLSAKYEEAINEYTLASQLNARNHNFNTDIKEALVHFKANNLITFSQMQDGIEDLTTKCTETELHDAKNFANISTCYLALKHHEKAISYAQNSLKINPNNIIAYINLGAAHLDNNLAVYYYKLGLTILSESDIGTTTLIKAKIEAIEKNLRADTEENIKQEPGPISDTEENHNTSLTGFVAEMFDKNTTSFE